MFVLYFLFLLKSVVTLQNGTVVASVPYIVKWYCGSKRAIEDCFLQIVLKRIIM